MTQWEATSGSFLPFDSLFIVAAQKESGTEEARRAGFRQLESPRLMSGCRGSWEEMLVEFRRDGAEGRPRTCLGCRECGVCTTRAKFDGRVVRTCEKRVYRRRPQRLRGKW